MNNLLSYCGLVDAKIRASDKDLPVMVGFIQKMLVKFSIITEYDQNIVPELLFPVNGMNDCDKMLFFSFFCISIIN